MTLLGATFCARADIPMLGVRCARSTRANSALPWQAILRCITGEIREISDVWSEPALPRSEAGMCTDEIGRLSLAVGIREI